MNNEGMNSEVLYRARKSFWSMTRSIVGMIVLMIIGVVVIVIGVPQNQWLIPIGAVMIVLGILVIAIMRWAISKYEIRFYKDRVIVHKGVINVREDQSILTPIVGVRLEQSLWQRMFNAGNVIVDKVGKGWDLDLTWVHDPKGLKKYLESLIDSTDYRNVGQFITQ